MIRPTRDGRFTRRCTRLLKPGTTLEAGKIADSPDVRRDISGGRADIRLALDGDGELYILSKSDGMIRAVVGAETH
jgi:hypothetical protein